jgi:hypothetical protein
VKHIAVRAILGTLIAASAGGCGEGPLSPAAPSSVTVTHSPDVGATVANGAKYEVRVDYISGGHFFDAVAFVRDDGVYSAPFFCGETGAGGGSGGAGGSGASATHDVRIPMLGFAVGRRVNLVVLFGSRNLCGAAVGVGTAPVDPSQADLGRKDVTLNWLIGG